MGDETGRTGQKGDDYDEQAQVWVCGWLHWSVIFDTDVAASAELR